MTHVFLTGEIQIGKSTVLGKVLSALGLPYGGFRTYFGADRESPGRRLFMRDAASPPLYDDGHTVVRFEGGFPAEIRTDAFDRLGASYITAARTNARLIVMDECGGFERQALRFQKAVFDALDGEIPVLGVVKLDAAGWADRLRRHPNVRLVTVDAQNRDALPTELARLFT